MAVKIKLKRLGKVRQPQYRIVVADARTKRDGRAIEEIGLYHPKEDPSRIEVNSERAQYWLSVGAQPTEPVLAILKVTGDWQRFKGLPGAEGKLRTAPARVDRRERYDRLMAEAKADVPDPARRPAATRPGAAAAKSTASPDPTSTQPTSTEPTSTEPTSTEPTSTEPTSTEPTSTEPTSTEPAAATDVETA